MEIKIHWGLLKTRHRVWIRKPMSCKSLDAKTTFWEHTSSCARAFTKYLISATTGNSVLAQMNFWSDLVQLFWCFHCFFHHATKAVMLPAQQVLSAHLLQGANYAGKGRSAGCALPSWRSWSAGLPQGTVKPADLTSQGSAGKEGNTERATLWRIQRPGVAQTAFGCQGCCVGVDNLLCSCMLGDDTAPGTETFHTKRNSTWESPGNQGTAHRWEKT